tara:strand:- start:62 stop:367 length:306 start_codon:yes stop_codon:yes gene_type:complete
MSLEKIIVKKGGFKSQEAFLKSVNKKSKSFYKDNFFMGKEKYLHTLSVLINDISEDSEVFNELTASNKPVKKKYAAELELFNSNYKSKLKTLENHVRFFKK